MTGDPSTPRRPARNAAWIPPFVLALSGLGVAIALYVFLYGSVLSFDGRGPLHRAAHDGDVEAIAELLDGGGDVDARITEGAAVTLGQTPLMIAAARNHAEAVRLLLDRGADPSLADEIGRTALDYHGRDDTRIAAMLAPPAADDDPG